MIEATAGFHVCYLLVALGPPRLITGVDMPWWAIIYLVVFVAFSIFADMLGESDGTSRLRWFADLLAGAVFAVLFAGFWLPSIYRALGFAAPASFRIIDLQPDILSGISLRWESAPNRTYSIYRSTNLAQGFINIQAFLPATPGTNTFRDSTATGPGPYFYRVRLD